MAAAQLVQQLKEQLDTVNRYRNTDLIRRPDWGTITFDIAAQDIETARSIATDLSSMPLNHLTNQAVHDIMGHVPNVSSCLQLIDEFRLEGVPARNRDNIASRLKSAVEQLHTVASQWIPYLAYKRGDLNENVEQTEAALAAAKARLDEANAHAARSQEEINKIVELTREASASIGVATFTHEFDTEADRLANRSAKWLWAVMVLAIVTLCAAMGSLWWPPLPDETNSWTTLRHVVGKVSVIAILFTGTIWCGRIYRALTHQRLVNRHRALSLKTFQTFVEATDDTATRDAVLMAATRSIFGSVPTGFVDERGTTQDTSVNVLEIGKSAGKAMSTRKATPQE